MLNLNTLRFGHVAQPTHSARQPLRFAATADLVQFGNDKKVNPEAQADTEVEAQAEAKAEQADTEAEASTEAEAAEDEETGDINRPGPFTNSAGYYSTQGGIGAHYLIDGLGIVFPHE